MAYVAIIKLRLPFFSIRNPESFQIGSSLPIPPPSSLVGALAYALAIRKKLGRDDALTKVRSYIISARVALTAKLVTIPSPVLLWRYRILDKRGDFLKLIESEGNNHSKVKKKLEAKFKDALYREYLFTHELDVVYILSKEIGIDVFKLISRLGDTESLCSVKNVIMGKSRIIKANKVRTKYPVPYDDKIIKDLVGSYMIIKMCDENNKLVPYIIPIIRRFRETRRGVKVTLYEASEVEIEFKRSIEMYKVNDDLIVGSY